MVFCALAEAGVPVICVETRHMRAVLGKREPNCVCRASVDGQREGRGLLDRSQPTAAGVRMLWGTPKSDHKGTESGTVFLRPRPAQIGDSCWSDHSAQLSLAEVLTFRDVADRRSQSAAHQDLAVRRLGAEPGR